MLVHDEARRVNIPTAEYQGMLEKHADAPLQVAYERHNRDLDPQLVWRGKDEQDWSDLVVQGGAKEKKATMETYGVPGVNNLRTQGRWVCAESRDVWAVQSDFAAKVEAEFNRIIGEAAPVR